VGNVHLVQLQNHPLYEREWSNYVSIGAAKRKTVKITNSLQWLERDLVQARNAGKIIILNFHDSDEHWGEIWANGAKGKTNLGSNTNSNISIFKNLLIKYNVAAVFVGHYHGKQGESDGSIGHNNQNKQSIYGSVPVFFCGSASQSKYLLTKFDGNKMTVEKVSSLNGIMQRSNALNYTVYNTKPSTPFPMPSQDGGITPAGCGCPEKTFRATSEHSWVEFRLPTGAPGQTVDIEGGAYNNYVFPKCNRVWWDNLKFKCNSNCTWEKISGRWDADANCVSSKSRSPYAFTGDR
jgi:hypothetical protein